jgi:hypothetical protein
LIRAVLHLDPDTLTDEMWVLQVKVAEAMQNNHTAQIWKPFSK